ncbi:MAG: hypothetical protein M1828_002532 [Chrysothrix sp. TS-e1954]|nr:MAG: hypothetical protein M1828_002532 [Chrysothrix sp. TS-e1954]
MAPQRYRKRISSSSAGSETLATFPAPPQTVATKGALETPPKIHMHKSVTITQLQKEALIEDLQQELTERARRLRAQYALQAANLRTRLEYRVERIPAALRKAKLIDLFEKHGPKPDGTSKGGLKATADKVATAPPNNSVSQPVSRPTQQPAKEVTVLVPLPRQAKRKRFVAEEVPIRQRPLLTCLGSDDMDDANKENDSIASPKKRARTNQPPSRQVPVSQVLSPKSNNSRQLPRSPTKALTSPLKSHMGQHISPSKSVATVATVPTTSFLAKTANKVKPKSQTSRVPSKQAASSATTTKAATLRGKTNGTLGTKSKEQKDARVSDASDGTNGSTGTTIVKSKSVATQKKPAQSVKGTKQALASKITSVTTSKARKAAEAKPARAAAPTVSRTLRKRT